MFAIQRHESAPYRASHVTVLTPRGPITTLAGAELLRAVRVQLTRGDLNFAIDLREVAKIDSEAVQTLVRIHRTIRNSGGSLVLVIANPEALEVIKVMRLDVIFPIEPSVDAAVRALESREPVPA